MEAFPVQLFIDRWKNSGAAKRANYQLFLSELCDVLGVPRPDPRGIVPLKGTGTPLFAGVAVPQETQFSGNPAGGW
jgi:hypothetical protein